MLEPIQKLLEIIVKNIFQTNIATYSVATLILIPLLLIVIKKLLNLII